MKKIILFLAFHFAFILVHAGVLDDKKFLISNAASGFLVVPTPDDGYVAASRNEVGPQLVYRLNAGGQVEWAKSIDLPSSILNDAGICPDNSSYLLYAATSYSGVHDSTFYYYGDRYIVVKLDPAGNISWTTGFDLSMTSSQYGIITIKPQPDGGLLFAASMNDRMAVVRLNANGSVASSFTIVPDISDYIKCPAFDAVTTDDGGIIVTGKNQSEPVIMKVGPGGNIAWTIFYSDSGYNQARSIIRTADGNYLIGGLFYYTNTGNGRANSFLMKVSASGSILWQKVYGLAWNSTAAFAIYTDFNQVMENPDGTITTAGIGSGSDGMYYSTVVTLSATGQVISSYAFGPCTIYPKLYKNMAGEVKISGLEDDASNGTFAPILFSTSQISSYCHSFSFELDELSTNTRIDLSPTIFTLQPMLPATHLDITTTDSTIGFSVEDICRSTGVNEVSKPVNISLEPNPVSSSAPVTLKWSSEESVKNILIQDINGRLMKQLESGGDNELTFSALGLLPGMYFVQLINNRNERISTKKLIVTE